MCPGMNRYLPLFGGADQITWRHLSACQNFDLKGFLQADPARTSQPVIDLARADRRIEPLPESKHRDAMCAQVLF